MRHRYHYSMCGGCCQDQCGTCSGSCQLEYMSLQVSAIVGSHLLRYCPVSITSVIPLLTSNNEEGGAAGVLRRGSRCIEQLCCLWTTIQGSLHWAAAKRRQHSSFSSDMYNAYTYYKLTITSHDEICMNIIHYFELFFSDFLTSVSFTDTDKLKYSNEIVWTCIITPSFIWRVHSKPHTFPLPPKGHRKPCEYSLKQLICTEVQPVSLQLCGSSANTKLILTQLQLHRS